MADGSGRNAAGAAGATSQGSGGRFRVLIAKPRGFCRGVENAISVVELAIELCGTPLYVKHSIVHNRAVIRDFEGRGVVFVERVTQIPRGAHAVFSAHGSPPEDYQAAAKRGIDVIDATCRLVTNVHNWARRFSQRGYDVVVIGHRNHPEPRGILGNLDPERRHLIESASEVDRLTVADEGRVASVTQTTLSVDDTLAIREALRARFPALREPPTRHSTICYATDNRQAAVKQLAKRADVVLVVGSEESSNTNRLCEVSEQWGAPAHRIDWAEEIDPAWLQDAKIVGVTSGASAPEFLVQQVLARLERLGGGVAEELAAVREEVGPFTLPVRIIELARAAGRDPSREGAAGGAKG